MREGLKRTGKEERGGGKRSKERPEKESHLESNALVGDLYVLRPHFEHPEHCNHAIHWGKSPDTLKQCKKCAATIPEACSLSTKTGFHCTDAGTDEVNRL